MSEMADFIVEADSVWHSGEGKFYLKGQTISLPASTRVVPGGSVRSAEKAKPKGKAKDAEPLA